MNKLLSELKSIHLPPLRESEGSSQSIDCKKFLIDDSSVLQLYIGHSNNEIRRINDENICRGDRIAQQVGRAYAHCDNNRKQLDRIEDETTKCVAAFNSCETVDNELVNCIDDVEAAMNEWYVSIYLLETVTAKLAILNELREYRSSEENRLKNEAKSLRIEEEIQLKRIEKEKHAELIERQRFFEEAFINDMREFKESGSIRNRVVDDASRSAQIEYEEACIAAEQADTEKDEFEQFLHSPPA